MLTDLDQVKQWINDSSVLMINSKVQWPAAWRWFSVPIQGWGIYSELRYNSDSLFWALSIGHYFAIDLWIPECGHTGLDAGLRSVLIKITLSFHQALPLQILLLTNYMLTPLMKTAQKLQEADSILVMLYLTDPVTSHICLFYKCNVVTAAFSTYFSCYWNTSVWNSMQNCIH